jgi:deazaflavin-dependent oxidoreductase (nitroreductase family)
MTETSTRQHAVTRRIIKAFTPFHRQVLRTSKGRIGQSWSSTRQPLLLLTTTGRRSGEPRTAVLGYIEDGGRLVVVASKGGLPEHPGWYHNIVANPQVTVERNGTVQPMRATVADAAEHERLWTIVSTRYPTFTTYQAGISRQIPIVILEPAD